MTTLTEERERLIQLLPQTEAGTEKYMYILEAIDKLGWLIDRGYAPTPAVTTYSNTETKESDCTVTTVQDYTKEEVREILTNASKDGIKIQPIMKQFIPEGQPAKLSSVPTASYAALVEAVRNAG